MTTEGREGLAALPPVAAADPNTPERRLAEPQGGERDPADCWGVTYSEPLPAVDSSPHWTEIQT